MARITTNYAGAKKASNPMIDGHRFNLEFAKTKPDWESFYAAYKGGAYLDKAGKPVPDQEQRLRIAYKQIHGKDVPTAKK